MTAQEFLEDEAMRVIDACELALNTRSGELLEAAHKEVIACLSAWRAQRGAWLAKPVMTSQSTGPAQDREAEGTDA